MFGSLGVIEVCQVESLLRRGLVSQIALKIFLQHLRQLSIDNLSVAVDLSQINPSHFMDGVGERWDF